MADIEGSNGLRTEFKAVGTRDCPEVEVTAGEKLTLPIGLPLKPVVVARRSKKSVVSLQLVIKGAAGETLTSLYTNGRRPPDPAFVITDSGGREVKRGHFEYG